MINTAILGFGYSAKTFHIPFIQVHPDFQLAALCSRRKPELAAELESCQYYKSVEELLADASIDLVIITTPNDLHFDYAKRCLEHGKHVVLEKPFVTRVEDGETLINLAQQKGLCLTVYQNRRWDGDFLTLKRLVEDKTLGKIKLFTSHFNRFRPNVRQRWREQAGDGTGIWFDLGPHLLDQTVQLFGMPKALTACCRQMRSGASATDYFNVWLHYEDMEVVLQSSPYCANETLRFDIQGEQGSYRKYGLDPQEEALKAGIQPMSEQWQSAIADQSGQIAFDTERQELTTQLGNYKGFFDALALSITEHAPVPVEPQQALNVIRLIDLAILSSNKCQRLDIA